ncbi:hypothetical protein HY994_01345 [Candidatus Micrarchaeota archaeon]|nr:hypothetical protein [Candidatus Micrarchaeota archaeon]
MAKSLRERTRKISQTARRIAEETVRKMPLPTAMRYRLFHNGLVNAVKSSQNRAEAISISKVEELPDGQLKFTIMVNEKYTPHLPDIRTPDPLGPHAYPQRQGTVLAKHWTGMEKAGWKLWPSNNPQFGNLYHGLEITTSDPRIHLLQSALKKFEKGV